MDNEYGFAEVNGTSLYYEITGTGFPVVLMHGGTLDTRMWDDQVPPFAQHYRVLRYDLWGYGRSAVPTEQPYDRTDDLRELLAFFDIDQAHIIGHSIGGNLATDFALAHPAATASLVLVDSAFSGYQWPPELTTEQQAVRALARDGDMQGAKQRWLQFISCLSRASAMVRVMVAWLRAALGPQPASRAKGGCR
jgi:pimeloyl-ACP methyl ester carboxylesterase